MASETLTFNVLAKDNASKTFDDVGRSADRVAGKVEKSNKRMGAGFAKFGRSLEKDVGVRVDKIGGGLGLLSNFIGGPLGAALVGGAMAFDTLSTAMSIVSVENVKAAAKWTVHKTAIVATTVATKAATIATRLFGIAMMVATGPIGLVILAVVALVAGLIIAYKKSETFRNIVNGVFNAVKTVALAVFKTVLKIITSVFNWVKANWPLLLAMAITAAMITTTRRIGP